MYKGDRKGERDLKEMKEEMENWKVRAKIEREKRDKLERKVQDLEEEVEILKRRTRENKEEKRREVRRWEELAQKVNAIEKGVKMETRKREVEKYLEERRRGEEIQGEKRKRGSERSKVWERGLIIHRGEKWEEGGSTNLDGWLAENLRGTVWEVEDTSNKDTKKLIFQTEEEMEIIWRKRDSINEEGMVRIEQWMCKEERRAKKEALEERERGEEEVKKKVTEDK